MSVVLAVCTSKFALLGADTRSLSGLYPKDNYGKIYPLSFGGYMGITGAVKDARKLVYVVEKYGGDLRKAMNDVTERNGAESSWSFEDSGMCLMISPGPKLTEVCDLWDWFECGVPSARGTGSGGDYAEGAFAALLGKRSLDKIGESEARRMIKDAINIAIKRNVGCGGDVQIECVYK